MRGHVDSQNGFFSYFSVEERIPADHRLRRIKAQADSVLASTDAAFEVMYAAEGRSSTAPERMLRASLLIRQFCAGLGIVFDKADRIHKNTEFGYPGQPMCVLPSTFYYPRMGVVGDASISLMSSVAEGLAHCMHALARRRK